MIHSTFTFLTAFIATASASPHWPVHSRDVQLQQEYISAHNNERAAHGASALIWDDGLSESAAAWANKCKFEHSQSGQNLAAGTGSPTPAKAVGWWNAESKDYNPANPQYSHWTQVVWKSTTKLGCAMASCPPGTIFSADAGTSSYFVCHYDPAGNVIGKFDENVQK